MCWQLLWLYYYYHRGWWCCWRVRSQREISQMKERKTKWLNTDEKVQLNENILDPLNSIQRLCMPFGFASFSLSSVTVSLSLQHSNETHCSYSRMFERILLFLTLSLSLAHFWTCAVCEFFFFVISSFLLFFLFLHAHEHEHAIAYMCSLNTSKAIEYILSANNYVLLATWNQQSLNRTIALGRFFFIE